MSVNSAGIRKSKTFSNQEEFIKKIESTFKCRQKLVLTYLEAHSGAFISHLLPDFDVDMDDDMEELMLEQKRYKYDFLGFHELEINQKSFHFLCGLIGGDGGQIFVFIVYVDENNQVRGYVPTNGNSLKKNREPKRIYTFDAVKSKINFNKIKEELIGSFELI